MGEGGARANRSNVPFRSGTGRPSIVAVDDLRSAPPPDASESRGFDARLFARVLWRFRHVVACGLALAIVLALLDAVRIDSHGIEYRHQPTYLSYARVFVTQQGFPWGRLDVSAPGSTGGVADPTRLTGLASVYSQLVTSDPVRARMARSHPPVGTIQAAPVLDPADSQSSLPIVSIAAFSSSAGNAMRLARDATRALVGYVGAQQTLNRIPAADRVQLQVVLRADHAQLEHRPSLAMPILIFLAVLAATCGLAFALENVARPSAAAARRRAMRSARSTA